MKIGDASAHVHLDFTAPDEHLPELLAPTLNAGLHARDRDARFPSRIGLCESANRCELDRRLIRFRQAADHRRQARGEFDLGGAQAGRVRVIGKIDFQRVCPSVTPLTSAERIAERVPRNLKEPRFRPVGGAKRIQMADDADEHLLKEIVSVDTCRDAPRQEGPERWREVIP
jgi:hypothetical protein